MKLLKVYISAFCMCSLSVLLNSCDDFLKEEPLDMKSSDQFWKTKADAESGVNALYFGGVPYGALPVHLRPLGLLLFNLV